jgi:D-glycero-beta-D-manno-heptose 1-phosphate adenylyltransferase
MRCDVTVERTLGEIVGRGELVERVAALKSAGKRVVFTNGCFDLLHPGHVRLLEQARSLGDALIVAINTDASVRGNKGTNRPITPENERAEILAGLAAVDFVALFDEATPREIVAAILPAVLVKGSDWGPNEIVGREEVEAAGGVVISIPLESGYSTTNLLERIQQLNA